jgi:hypothetical protein
MRITGDVKQIEEVRTKLSTLFADDRNHMQAFTLIREPSSKEQNMIK